MSVQGELSFSLSVLPTTTPTTTPASCKRVQCRLRSTRPVGAVRLFEGKSIDFALTTLPMLFNVCGRAQAVTLARAVESELGVSVPTTVAQRRQALVKLETLREQVFRVLVDWPGMTKELPQSEVLAGLVQGLAHLSECLEPQAVLIRSYGDSMVEEAMTSAFAEAWPVIHDDLCGYLFGQSAAHFLQSVETLAALDHWVSKADTQASRFLNWLETQPWSDAGDVPESCVFAMADETLRGRFEVQSEVFSAKPDDQGASPEVSWFTGMAETPLKAALHVARGNGLYTRCTCRLILIAQLLRDLSRFAIGEVLALPEESTVRGMAHTEAARGRLTHWITLRDETVERLFVLAPTEWNFHPQGIAVNALEALMPEDSEDLEVQAQLLIHAIDPCVGYRLDIHDSPPGKVLEGWLDA